MVAEQDFLKTLDTEEKPAVVSPDMETIPGDTTGQVDESSFLNTLDKTPVEFKEDLALSEVPPPNLDWEAKDAEVVARGITDSSYMKSTLGGSYNPSAMAGSDEYAGGSLPKALQKNYDLVKSHYKYAENTSQMDDLYHDLLDARENGKSTAAIEAKIAAMPVQTPPTKPVYPWEKAAAFTAGQVPIWADIGVSGVETGMAMSILGGTAGAVTTGGPGAVPAAGLFYAAGQTYGSGKKIWQIMEGNSYREMLDAGVDEKYARNLARYGVGPVSAALNILSFGMFKQMAPVAIRKLLGTVTDKTSKGIMKGRVAKLLKSTATEVITEDLEEINQIIMTEVGINLTNELRKAKGLEMLPGITRDEFVTRIKDVTEATLYATMTLGGATTTISYGADKYMGVDSKKDNKENVIDMTAHMMDKTTDQQREEVKDSGAIILGVEENEDGEVTGMLMADRKSGEIFETGPNPTAEEIYTQTGKIPQVDIDIDKVIETGDIESAFDVEAVPVKEAVKEELIEPERPVVDETAAFVDQIAEASPEEQEVLFERRHEEIRGKRVSEMTPEEKNEALGDKLVADMSEVEKNAALLKADVTGMPNRRAWNEHNATDPHSVQVAIDLDGLKFGNDFGGHPFGDDVLNKTAAAMSESIAEGSRDYHFGGDEFVLTAKDAESAKKALINLHNKTADTIMELEIDGHVFTYPLSFGFGTDLTGDFKNADKNLIRAKQEAKASGEVADRGEPPKSIVGRDPQGREMARGEIATFFENKRKEAGVREEGQQLAPDVLAEEVRQELKQAAPLSTTKELRSAVDEAITPAGRKNLDVEVVQTTDELMGKLGIDAKFSKDDTNWEKTESGKLIGYKVMAIDENGKLRSGADSRLSFANKAGETITMTGDGVFLSNKPQYVLEYYSELADNEALLKLEFDPADIKFGESQLDDREPEIGLSSVTILETTKIGTDDVSFSKDGTIEGAFDPRTGKIYLVADNIPTDQAWAKLLHEGTHKVRAEKGWSGVFGKQSGKIMADIDAKLKANDPAWKNAEKKAIAAKTPEKSVREETITYFLADNSNKKESLWKRIVTAIRTWAVRSGIKKNVTDQDIVNLAEASVRRAAIKSGGLSLSDRIMFSKRDAEPFFSQLEKVIIDKLPGKGTASSFKQAISSWVKKGEIKQEEVDWSGVNDFLDQQEGKLTKQDVGEYLKANNVRVEEVIAGDNKNITEEDQQAVEEAKASLANLRWKRNSIREELSKELDNTGLPGVDIVERIDSSANQRYSEEEISEAWDQVPADTKVDFNQIHDINDQVKAVEQELSVAEEMAESYSTNEVKFADYQLPGGENYKELLLTLPVKELTFDGYKEYVNRNRTEKYQDNVLRKMYDELSDADRTYLSRKASSEYNSPHFDEPNVLAHVRMNERTDAEGNKVLFIEEIQSDWHQAGRKKGYGETEKVEIESLLKTQKEIGSKIESERAWLDEFMGETREEMKEGKLSLNQTLDNHGLRERFDDYNVLIGKSTQIRNDIDMLRSKQRQAVPDAPFKKSWSLLAIKSMIQKASTEGFDKIAWTTGEQQAERYDLSKQVKRIAWARRDDGNYDILIYPKNAADEETISRESVPSGDLTDLVGKEIADSIVKADGKPAMTKGHSVVGEIKGPDLKVGGEGMKGFYDKILPATVKKFIKKFGGKVGETNVAAEGQKVLADEDNTVTGKTIIRAAELAREAALSGNEEWKETRNNQAAKLEEYAGKQIEDIPHNVMMSPWIDDALKEQGETLQVHSFDITPQMKEAAATTGMPLFSKRVDDAGEQKTRINPETVQAIKSLAEQVRAAKASGNGKLAASLRLELVEMIGKAKSEAASAQISTLTEKERVRIRRQTISTIRDYFGLTDNDLQKISRKDVRLMSKYEFKKFKDDIQKRALEFSETRQAKIELLHTIHTLNLQKVDNFREAMELPPIRDMSLNQLRDFDELIGEFHEGDSFLNKRQLETVDRTFLEGIRTWREAKEKLAAEAGVSVGDLDTIKVSGADNFKWDNSLYESNPFYRVLVTRVTTSLLDAQLKAHDVETDVYDLAKKAQKSVKRSLADRAIPNDKQIFDYLEANKGNKKALASQMTSEQLDLAHYMQEYFSQALTYLLETKSLNRGRENYFVHMRRTLLESIREDGLITGVKEMFKNYEQDQMAFGILDDNTGNILPLEKFFQFSLQRSGALTPTKNIVRAFLTYMNTFEKKVALDGIIPAMSIYAQSLTPTVYTQKGLEIDQSIKKFVNQYINNKKGRRISYDSVVKQGGKLDLILNSTRMLVSMLKLGFSPIAQTAAPIGEQSGNLIMMGVANQAKGTARMATKKGKAIVEKYEAVVGRSLFETLTAPGEEVTGRITSAMFAGFHAGSRIANAQYLLGMMTDAEYESGTISTKRLAELELEKGRFRAVPGTASLVGSTSAGKLGTQFKSWAIPVIRTTLKDLGKVAKDLAKKPYGEKLSTKEAAELLRITGLTATVLAMYGIYQADEDDDSLMSKMVNRVLSEASLIYSAFDVRWMLFTTPPAIKWAQDLGMILADMAQLVEYKDGSGLKGPKRLVRHFTPGFVKSFQKKKKKPKY